MSQEGSGRSRILKRGVQFQFHTAKPKVAHRGVQLRSVCAKHRKKIRLHFSLFRMGSRFTFMLCTAI